MGKKRKSGSSSQNRKAWHEVYLSKSKVGPGAGVNLSAPTNKPIGPLDLWDKLFPKVQKKNQTIRLFPEGAKRVGRGASTNVGKDKSKAVDQVENIQEGFWVLGPNGIEDREVEYSELSQSNLVKDEVKGDFGVYFKSEENCENIIEEEINRSADDHKQNLVKYFKQEDQAEKLSKNPQLEPELQPNENEKCKDPEWVSEPPLTPEQKFLIIKRCLEDKNVSATDVSSNLDLNLDMVRDLMQEVKEVVPPRMTKMGRKEEHLMDFYCEFCDAKFLNRELLKDHMKSESHHRTMVKIRRLS